VTGKPIGSAFIVTRTSSSADVLYTQSASLQLSCFMTQPVSNSISRARSAPNSYLGYRFDEKPGHEIGARLVKGASAVVIEDKAEVAQFVSELATSKVLLRAHPLAQRRTNRCRI